MLKQAMAVSFFLAVFISGTVSASMANANTNHPSYWESSSNKCSKTEVKGEVMSYDASGNGVVKVIVKGGPSYEVYDKAPFNNVKAPVNEKNNKNYAISHVIVCRGDKAPAQPFVPTEPAKPEVKPSKPEKPAEKNEKVTICHATSSKTNPYVKITISKNALKGHFNEHGTPRSGHLDDIMLDDASEDCPGPVNPTEPQEEPEQPAKPVVPADEDPEAPATVTPEGGKGAGEAPKRPESLPVTGANGILGALISAVMVTVASTVGATKYFKSKEDLV
jgi:hypothetical protein